MDRRHEGGGQQREAADAAAGSRGGEQRAGAGARGGAGGGHQSAVTERKVLVLLLWLLTRTGVGRWRSGTGEGARASGDAGVCVRLSDGGERRRRDDWRHRRYARVSVFPSGWGACERVLSRCRRCCFREN